MLTACLLRLHRAFFRVFAFHILLFQFLASIAWSDGNWFVASITLLTHAALSLLAQWAAIWTQRSPGKAPLDLRVHWFLVKAKRLCRVWVRGQRLGLRQVKCRLARRGQACLHGWVRRDALQGRCDPPYGVMTIYTLLSHSTLRSNTQKLMQTEVAHAQRVPMRRIVPCQIARCTPDDLVWSPRREAFAAVGQPAVGPQCSGPPHVGRHQCGPVGVLRLVAGRADQAGLDHRRQRLHRRDPVPRSHLHPAGVCEQCSSWHQMFSGFE